MILLSATFTVRKIKICLKNLQRLSDLFVHSNITYGRMIHCFLVTAGVIELSLLGNPWVVVTSNEQLKCKYLPELSQCE